MSFRLLNRCAILLFVFVSVARTEAARIKVAILDQGFTLADHFVDEAMQIKIREDFGGDREALIQALKQNNETLSHFRAFTSEELILHAMGKRETGQTSNGRAPRTEAEWLASLRKNARIQFLPAKESAVNNDARLRWGR